MSGSSDSAPPEPDRSSTTWRTTSASDATSLLFKLPLDLGYASNTYERVKWPAVIDIGGRAVRAYTTQTLTTAGAGRDEAASVWTELICETFVKLEARCSTTDSFRGEIRQETLGELEFSTVSASGQDVYRTPRFAATAADEFLLFSIQRVGEGFVEQDGRVARLRPGGIALYDSGRPYSLHFPSAFRQLVVQLPKSAVGVDDTQSITATAHGVGSLGGVVAQMLVAMNDQLGAAGSTLDPMVDHVLGSLSEILRERRTPHDVRLPDQYLRQQAESMMRRDLHDSTWTVDKLAARCHVSIRTLYRLFPDGGVSTAMRRMRIDAASAFLRQHPQATVGAVSQRFGFDSESGFIRAFRAEAGTTPRRFVAGL